MDIREMITVLGGYATFAFVIFTFSSCVQNDENKIAELVKQGTAPIAARCAITGRRGLDPKECLGYVGAEGP